MVDPSEFEDFFNRGNDDPATSPLIKSRPGPKQALRRCLVSNLWAWELTAQSPCGCRQCAFPTWSAMRQTQPRASAYQ